ncbi:hypothetical protein POUND7_002021 [Theobroma cacao]
MCLKDFLVLFVLIKVAASSNEGFIFNGFSSGLVSGQNKSLELAGVAEVSDGLCRLTNTESFKIGHAFYSVPFRFKNSSNTNAFSFSTTFVFAMVPENFRGHGMAFVLAPSQEFISGQGVASGQHLGLFNRTNNGNPSNHIVAVELDTFLNQEFGDPNGNHVGIDINSLSSVNLTSANDVPESGLLDPVDLVSGEGGQLWVEYDGAKHQLNVTLSRFNTSKPEPLLSVDIDLSPFILDQMYVGFSSATAQLTASSYVLGWSFQIDGKAEDLDLAKLPSVPSASIERSGKKKITLAVGLSIAGVLFVGVIVSVIFILKRKKDTFVELVEDWEFQFGPHSKLAQDPQTTHVAGTFGYMAPELAKTGKASTSTDVYAFGAFCLEVTCGRRPIKQRASAEEVHLVDWVFKCWKEGDILKTADSKLENDFKVGETDLVLKLGLLCSHNVAAHRPRMSQVILYLRGQASLPENLDLILHTSELVEESSDYSAPSTNDFTRASVTITESFLSRGR